LRAVLDIGSSMGVTPPPIAARALRLLDRLSLALDPVDVAVADVVAYIEADKKRRGGRLRWVLVSGDGISIREDVPPAIARAAVTKALSGRG
jgi:3-dehydroquinate synthetase